MARPTCRQQGQSCIDLFSAGALPQGLLYGGPTALQGQLSLKHFRLEWQQQHGRRGPCFRLYGAGGLMVHLQTAGALFALGEATAACSQGCLHLLQVQVCNSGSELHAHDAHL